MKPTGNAWKRLRFDVKTLISRSLFPMERRHPNYLNIFGWWFTVPMECWLLLMLQTLAALARPKRRTQNACSGTFSRRRASQYDFYELIRPNASVIDDPRSGMLNPMSVKRILNAKGTASSPECFLQGSSSILYHRYRLQHLPGVQTRGYEIIYKIYSCSYDAAMITPLDPFTKSENWLAYPSSVKVSQWSWPWGKLKSPGSWTWHDITYNRETQMATSDFRHLPTPCVVFGASIFAFTGNLLPNTLCSRGVNF